MAAKSKAKHAAEKAALEEKVRAKQASQPPEVPAEPKRKLRMTDVAPPDELPLVHSLGWAHVPRRGWVVVETTSRGLEIIDQEILSEPASKAAAWMEFRIATVRRIYPDESTVSA